MDLDWERSKGCLDLIFIHVAEDWTDDDDGLCSRLVMVAGGTGEILLEYFIAFSC